MSGSTSERATTGRATTERATTGRATIAPGAVEPGAAYLGAEGYESQLDEELSRLGLTTIGRHGRLVLTAEAARDVAWAANIWQSPRRIEIGSIADGARALRALQRNWWPYAPAQRGRLKLITERLPHVSARPVPWGSPAPRAPLGSFTLLAPDVLLASADCSSPFPDGEAALVEDRVGPPSRAYLKLWEALLRIRCAPGPNDRALDLGASPGGWTWVLARLGARVLAVDKAPLASSVAHDPLVTWRRDSAFAIDPQDHPEITWLCSDVIAYPRRLVGLVRRWVDAGVPNIVCTVKFQGATDHAAVDDLRTIPSGSLFHLHHNRHELTFARVAARDADHATVHTGACEPGGRS